MQVVTSLIHHNTNSIQIFIIKTRSLNVIQINRILTCNCEFVALYIRSIFC